MDKGNKRQKVAFSRMHIGTNGRWRNWIRRGRSQLLVILERTQRRLVSLFDSLLTVQLKFHVSFRILFVPQRIDPVITVVVSIGISIGATFSLAKSWCIFRLFVLVCCCCCVLFVWKKQRSNESALMKRMKRNKMAMCKWKICQHLVWPVIFDRNFQFLFA